MTHNHSDVLFYLTILQAFFLTSLNKPQGVRAVELNERETEVRVRKKPMLHRAIESIVAMPGSNASPFGKHHWAKTDRLKTRARNSATGDEKAADASRGDSEAETRKKSDPWRRAENNLVRLNLWRPQAPVKSEHIGSVTCTSEDGLDRMGSPVPPMILHVPRTARTRESLLAKKDHLSLDTTADRSVRVFGL